jgi:hypothetical protein
MHVRIEKWSKRPEDTVFELDSLGQAWNKEDVLRYLGAHIYPERLIQGHILRLMDLPVGKTISQVEELYRSTLGYSFPLSIPAISDAIVVWLRTATAFWGSGTRDATLTASM